jgi:hypothetical protein
MISRIRASAVVLSLVAVLLGFDSQLVAQAVFGGIYGTITDPSGSAVKGATVTVIDTAKGLKQSVETNESGEYRIERLIPDTYTVTVSTPGFAPVETTGIIVTANGTPKVDEVLKVAGGNEQITVNSAPPALQTDTAQVSDRISEQTIADLPNLTRNFMQNQVLTAGTVRSTSINTLSQNPQGSASYSINGQNFGTQSWVLDGTDDRDPVLGIIVINPTLDSVQGMQVLTQNYNAEFGGGVGGIITAETKSGGNSFHGDVFFYRHTDAQQARNPFTQFQTLPGTNRFLPTSVYGQFGGSVSGPIIKNRTFFFADYQGIRQKSGNSLLLSVPTALVRSTCLTPGSTTCNLSEYLAGGVRQIYSPVNQTPYANNMIPTSQLSPQAVALLSILPAPNVAGAGTANNYIVSGFGPNNGNAADFRLDDQTTKNLHTFARYSYSLFKLSGANAFGIDGGGGLGPGNFAGNDWVQDQNLSSGGDMAVNPRWATDFRFGMLKYQVNINSNDFGTTPAANLGIPGINTTLQTSGSPNYLFTNSGISNLGSTVAYNGSQICNCPLRQSEEEFQFTNNWTHTVGNHSIRFGGDYRYALQYRFASDTSHQGILNFSQATTGSATGAGGLDLATALLGDVSNFQRWVSFTTQAATRQKRLALYGQDTWRATPKLNLTYGLRWDMTFPETINQAGLGGFTNISTGYVQVAGVGGIGTNGGQKMDYTNLSPRLGFAYQVRPEIVVRGGAAIVYDSEGVYGELFGTSLTNNIPALVSQNLQPTNSNGYVFTLAQGPPAAQAPVIPANGLIPMANGTTYAAIRTNRIQLPETYEWNLSVQEQFGKNTTAEIAYVGNVSARTYPGISDGNVNENQWVLPTTPAQLANQTAREPYFNKFDNNGVVCCNTTLVSVAPQARANYNALQTKLTERISSGLSLQANYTWSKAMNYNSEYFAFQPSATYSRNDLNRTNIFNLYGTYELPFGKGKMFTNSNNTLVNDLVGGWQINGNSTWEGGLPFTPTYAECSSEQDVDVNSTSGYLCRPNGTASGFPLKVQTFNPVSHSARYFAPVAPLTSEGASSGPFTRPGFGQFGNIGRNSFVGPSEFIADASLIKKVPITERVQAEFQFQAFNVFNHPALALPTQFGTNGPCIDCTTGTPGVISGLDPNITMRQLQFAARVSF